MGLNTGAVSTVIMLSPGFPTEMSYFTRALAGAGATVIGVGDQPPHDLPEAARGLMAHYEHVSLADEGAVFRALHGLARHFRFDQVECLWEPYMLLAARIRESFGLPGITVSVPTAATCVPVKCLRKSSRSSSGTPSKSAITIVVNGLPFSSGDAVSTQCAPMLPTMPGTCM